jgi:hypothetical protein
VRRVRNDFKNEKRGEIAVNIRVDLPPLINEIRPILRLAEQGDQEAMAELRVWLDANPAAWRQIADLRAMAVEAQIAAVAGDDLLARESLKRRLAELEEKFAGKDPSPLERLLVTRIAISWLQICHADRLLAGAQGASCCHVRALEQRVHRAQGRLLAAVKEQRLVQTMTP